MLPYIHFRHYIAYFPRIFRPGVIENIVVSTHGFPHNVDFTVKVVDSKTEKRVVAEKKQIVTPGIIT